MILVAAGGVVGSLLRYILNELFGSDKTGVLIANQIGVAIASYAAIYFLKNENKNLQNFIVPGFCGGLTTFSSVILLSNEFGFVYILENLFMSLLVVTFVVPFARSKN